MAQFAAILRFYLLDHSRQAKVESRSDVLVYTTAPLREELEVTGTVQLVLYAATSANDTDFTAKFGRCRTPTELQLW